MELLFLLVGGIAMFWYMYGEQDEKDETQVKVKLPNVKPLQFPNNQKANETIASPSVSNPVIPSTKNPTIISSSPSSETKPSSVPPPSVAPFVNKGRQYIPTPEDMMEAWRALYQLRLRGPFDKNSSKWQSLWNKVKNDPNKENNLSVFLPEEIAGGTFGGDYGGNLEKMGGGYVQS